MARTVQIRHGPADAFKSDACLCVEAVSTSDGDSK